jgi:hypothetical protein
LARAGRLLGLPVRPPGPGTCLVCCGPAAGGFAQCFACRVVSRRLNRPLAFVLPLRLCPAPGPLYSALMGYKESPVDLVRRRFGGVVAAHFADLLGRHACCVETLLGGPVDLVLPVPSTARPGAAPLERVDGLDALAGHVFGPQARWDPAIIRRSHGVVGHMRPHARAFALAEGAAVEGDRVVLLDDIYVSGSRSQSAAATLRRSGARSVVIVPLGRFLRPDRVRAHAEYVDGTSQDAAAGNRCARCVLPQPAAALG